MLPQTNAILKLSSYIPCIHVSLIFFFSVGSVRNPITTPFSRFGDHHIGSPGAAEFAGLPGVGDVHRHHCQTDLSVRVQLK